MQIRNREHAQQVEKQIIRAFVRSALKAGYRLAVSTERGYDIDEMLLGSRDIDKIMAEATSGDDCHIFVQYPDGDLVRKGVVMSMGWVYLVFGNDGWDVISDYTTNLESLMASAQKIIDRYC